MATAERGDRAGNPDDAADADALDRAWDALVREPAVHPGGRRRVEPAPDPAGPPVPDGFDPALAAAIRRLHDRDDVAGPEAGFAAQLWQRLVAPTGPDRGATPAPSAARGTRGAHPLRFVQPQPLAWSPLQLVAVAALLLALFGSSFGGRGLLPNLSGGSPTVSAERASPTGSPPLAARRWLAAPPTPGGVRPPAALSSPPSTALDRHRPDPTRRLPSPASPRSRS